MSVIDSELSYLYKQVESKQVPLKYLVLKPKLPIKDFPDLIEDYEVTHLPALVEEYLNSGKPLTDMAKDILRPEYVYDKRLDPVVDGSMLLINALKPETIDDNVLRKVNEVYHNAFNDERQLLNAYLIWYASYKQSLEQDLAVYERIKSNESKLESLEPLMFSVFNTTKIGIQCRPQHSLSHVDLFEQAKVSLYVPFIQYKTPSETLYKVYLPPTRNIIERHMLEATKDNHIYFTLWLSQDIAKINNYTAYTLVAYDLSSGRLYLEMPYTVDINQDYVRDLLMQHVNLTITNFSKYSVYGTFKVYGVEVVDEVLLDLVLNDDVFNAYLYVDESRTPTYLKKNAKYKVKAGTYATSVSSGCSFRLNQLYATPGEMVDVYNPTTRGIININLTANQPYVVVNVYKAISDRVVFYTQNIISHLLALYNTKDKDIIERYRIIGLDLKPDVRTEREIRTSRIQQIRSLASDLFVSDYARLCQSIAQPLLITPGEVDYWREKGRQIMYFPPDSKKWIIVCPTDERPYPGVKLNRILSNARLYPYIPCCYRTDQMDPRANSRYNEYYLGRQKQHQRRGLDNKIVTNKILQVGRIGDLPMDIVRLFRYIGATTYDNDQVVRYGVVHSPNSFIHAVATVMAEGYNTLKDEDKERYVIDLRQRIITYVNPAVAKQQMYEYSEEEILRYLSSPMEYFDSDITFRVLEEIFNVNIVVFFRSDLEVGRYKYFPIRSYRQRPTLAIYKHWGAETDNLAFPHYELIVIYHQSKVIDFILSPEAAKRLYDVINDSHRVMQWSPGGNKVYNSPTIVDRYRPFIIAQYIDNVGKARAFVVKQDDKYVTIIVQPSAPENVTTIKKEDLPLTSLDDIRSLFGPPTSYDVSEQTVLGVWYTLDDTDVYVPVVPVEGDFLPHGPPNPIYAPTALNSHVERLVRLNETVNIMLRLVLWLYNLWTKARPSSTVDDFIEQTFVLEEGDVSDEVYNFSSLSTSLPDVGSFDEAIVYLSSTGLIQQGRIYMYSLRLLEGIRFFLMTTLKNYSDPKVDRIRPALDKYKAKSNELVFLSRREIEDWLHLIERNPYKVYTALSTDLSSETEPYSFLDNNKLYIVQNVEPTIDREVMFKRAAYIGHIWSQTRHNVGYHNREEYECKFNVYVISPASRLQLIKQEGDVDILDYGNGMIAALLTAG